MNAARINMQIQMKTKVLNFVNKKTLIYFLNFVNEVKYV